MSDYSDPPSDPYDSGGSQDFEDFHDNDSDYDVPSANDKGKKKFTGVEHRSLPAGRLQETLREDINRVASIVGLEHPIVSILLQHFRWNEDRLLERFMDSPSAVLQEIGEPEHEEPAHRPTKRVKLTPVAFTCGICLDEPDPSNIAKLRCTHAFCAPCWRMYIQSKIVEDGQTLFCCMEQGCRTYVDEPFINELMDSSIQERYQELLRRDYVKANTNLRFCPHPSCDETVSCTGGRGSSLLTEVPTVSCGKGHAFCFGCGMDSDHRPCICKFVGLWLKNAQEDSGTAQWMKANTRECPKCHNAIEKAGGCNRIMCRNCRYEFCWLCLKNWGVHGYQGDENCTAWKELEPDSDASEAQQKLKKYHFYFDRFNNHEVSARLDQQLCEQTQEKMVMVQEIGQLSWIEAKFMQHAVDELTGCRRSLKWSYAMAYYLAPGNHKQIFEDLQANLETAVEDLSQMLEEDIEAKSVKGLRQRMMDKTIYVKNRHEILLNDTAAGLHEARWEWLDTP